MPKNHNEDKEDAIFHAHHLISPNKPELGTRTHAVWVCKGEILQRGLHRGYEGCSGAVRVSPEGNAVACAESMTRGMTRGLTSQSIRREDMDRRGGGRGSKLTK